jgi:hypothetical protein
MPMKDTEACSCYFRRSPVQLQMIPLEGKPPVNNSNLPRRIVPSYVGSLDFMVDRCNLGFSIALYHQYIIDSKVVYQIKCCMCNCLDQPPNRLMRIHRTVDGRMQNGRPQWLSCTWACECLRQPPVKAIRESAAKRRCRDNRGGTIVEIRNVVNRKVSKDAALHPNPEPFYIIQSSSLVH